MQIRIVADFVLVNDHVTITVDPKLIQENDKYKAVSVKVAPYWCNSQNNKGYAPISN